MTSPRGGGPKNCHFAMTNKLFVTQRRGGGSKNLIFAVTSFLNGPPNEKYLVTHNILKQRKLFEDLQCRKLEKRNKKL